jgi:hypothetical protein
MRLGWATDTDIEPFLAQGKLVEDCLASHVDTIGRAERIEEKHAVIWCVSNLVPLLQFARGGLTTVLYERLCRHPEFEVPRIFEAIEVPYRSDVFARIDRPSTTTRRSSAVVSGEDKVSHWKKALSPEQIDRILSVVQAFGLDHIYGDAVMPLATAIWRSW